MAQRTMNVVLESTITGIRIDPVGNQLYLEGVIRIAATGEVVRTYSENVTALLDATDIAAATRLVTRSQGWIDAKLAAL